MLYYETMTIILCNHQTRVIGCMECLADALLSKPKKENKPINRLRHWFNHNIIGKFFSGKI